MRILPVIVAGSAALALAACGDGRTDDVVRAPADGGTLQEVSEQTADAATSQAALALGLTRKQLEDADIVSPVGVDLGDVESLVIDASNAVTHLVVEVDGPEDVKVLLPIDKVQVHVQADGDKDLKTELAINELLALPRYTHGR